jgi:tRNA-modifying protein YgfZ
LNMSSGYQALRHAAAWLDLGARGRLVARGRDRVRFLHNVSSNDVKKMTPGAGSYAFLLSPQGRIQADLCLFCFDDRFLIDTEPELREKARQQILRYKVADQVEVEDVTAQTAAIGVEGPGAAAVLGSLGVPLPEEPYAHLQWNDATVAAVTVTGQPGFRIYTSAEASAEIAGRLQAAGAQPATGADARLVRIENGLPRYGEDIRETTLPQETRQMHAVSFTKGCYLGQEIVERIRAQGHVNKLLSRLEIDTAEPPPPGTKVMAENGEAGEITSAVYSPEKGKSIALAYLRTAFAETGRTLSANGMTALVS